MCGTVGRSPHGMITSRTAARTRTAREGGRVATNKARVKSVEESIRDTEEPDHQLKKNLSALDLTVFGVGVIIGTGIFVLTGEVASTTAGPAGGGSFLIPRHPFAAAGPLYPPVPPPRPPGGP